MLSSLESKSHLVSANSVDELSRRPSRPPDHAVENRALVALADKLTASSEGILQELAEAALILCRADSAGVSILDASRSNFYWPAIAGEWASHVGGGTPSNFGPCGTVLDRNTPLLFSHPERDFPYFADVMPLLEEALLIPFYVKGEAVGTIWVVSHHPRHRFETEDLRVMISLATFAATAYQTLTEMAEARRALEAQALLLQEMGHRIKNQFALANALVTLSSSSADSPEHLAQILQERLAALGRAHALTRRDVFFGEGLKTASLHELLRTVVAPYESAPKNRVVISGKDVQLRENQLINMALVLNEMATNSAKYGALSFASGFVRIECAVRDKELLMTWRERGGPSIHEAPNREGFGGRLERQIVTNHFGGRLSKDWGANGLVVDIAVPLSGL